MAKMHAENCRFGMFLVPYRPPSGKILSYSCRGGHMLQNEWCYIKIRQVLSVRNEQRVIEPHKHVKDDNFENLTK